MAQSRSARPAAAGDGEVDLDRDRALVRRCQDGDGAAFAELYTQYHDRLHRFCVRRMLDHDEADEVTQEAFLRAWRALPTFGGGLRFYPWLTVIAKNLCTDALRRRARCSSVQNMDRQPLNPSRLDPFSTTVSSEETVMAAFDGALAAEAMTRLSDRHRHVLRLREERGLSYQEIATAEGVEISTVETLLWRARQALKREYAALSGTPVLGGLLIAGGALRRLSERVARRTSRLVLATGGVRVRELAAAGVVTVALVGVTGSPTTSANPRVASAPIASGAPSTPAEVTNAAIKAPTAFPSPGSVSQGLAQGPVPTPVRSSDPPTSGSGAPSASIPQTPSLPSPGTPLATVANQLPVIASQVTDTVSQIVNDVTQAAATLPGLVAPLNPVTKVVSSVTGLLPGS